MLVALFAIPASAQVQGAFNNACFQGIDDADSPATLSPCDSPDLLNTESNLQGTAILKRKGFQKTADLTVSTGPVNGSHTFIDASGNRQDIVCQDHNCAHSVNGNSFSVFISTAGGASIPRRWSWVDIGGVAYGANDKRDTIIKYDGTTLTSPVGMPNASILELTQSRLVAGDISGQPNRVWYSSAGAVEQFTVGGNPPDSYYDDIGAPGDRIRGLKYIGGNLYIFKSNSITLCQLDNQYTSICSVISPSLGTTDPAAIITAGDYLYFRAQDKNYWEIGPQGFKQISKKIPNLVKSQSGGLGGGEASNTQTSQADWNAGSQTPSNSWNAATISGSIFPSTIVAPSNQSIGQSNWYMSDIDTSAYPSYLANFEGPTLAKGLVFQSMIGTATPSGNELRFNAVSYPRLGEPEASAAAVVEHSSGTWSFVFMSTDAATNNDNLQIDHWYLSSSSDVFSTNGYVLAIANSISGIAKNSIRVYKWTGGNTAGTIFSKDSLSSDYFNGVYHIVRTERAANGYMNVHIDGVSIATFTDTTYSTSTWSIVESRAPTIAAISTVHIASFTAPAFYNNQVSVSYNTQFSTPIYGVYSVSITSSSSSSATVKGQVSSDAVTWDSLVTLSSGSVPSFNAKKYVRHSVILGPESDSSTIVNVMGIYLVAATTGQFVTQCIQPNTSISAWGNLACAQTLSGGGSEVFYATSAATCGALPSGAPLNAAGVLQNSWVAQTNNSTLSISTNSAVKIGWRSLLNSATDQAQIDSCILSWTEGTASQASWAAWDSVRNAIYWTATINGASSTNRLLKYDRNLMSWYPFDISAQAPRVINNSLYFGGASAGTWNLYGGVDSDAGAAINAYWLSKDIGSDSPFNEKNFTTLSILSRNNGNGSMTGTYTFSNAQTSSYTISLSTGTGINYARSNFNLPLSSPQQFMNVKVGNNSSTPFEVLGIGATWNVNPWRVSGP